MALEAGTRLGHYEVVSSLGAGGMGDAADGTGLERFGRALNIDEQTLLIGAYYDQDHGPLSGNKKSHRAEKPWRSASTKAAGCNFGCRCA